MQARGEESHTGEGNILNELPALEAASDRIAAEIAQLSAALSDRCAWSAAVGADHTSIVANAAQEAFQALERAERETENFVKFAEELRTELRTLGDLEVAVRRILQAIEVLEARAAEVLTKKRNHPNRDVFL